ncbi:DUF2812 domain-containing protein [Clostridium sp. SYSU_GA19001]|uniref:DUF2812 domain-containing protein n=1 Tax=Clostridium caldaquaticum TaxID=2940653 RepID=UPI00207772EA|nr:DUF2812 domain-containing protein [Clostridium caldaquaticum]MCM8709549.1 DUF2812 domain-containing protein [Clostridium caldaquaticum]
MKVVVRKLFINYEKEEKWLNDMAAKGLNLVYYSIGKYIFEKGMPSEYIYRIELLNKFPSNPESKAYINFMEESGVECVASYMRWVYFRKKANEGSFDIYSDYDSRIKLYKKIAILYGTVALLNLFPAISNFILSLKNGIVSHFFNFSISILNLTITAVSTQMFISHIKKIKRMKNEKQLYE